jgi:hypothetical protein
MSADTPSELVSVLDLLDDLVPASSTPAPAEPDPLDEAAFRVLNPSDGPGEFPRVVYLDTAKRIRDEAAEAVADEHLTDWETFTLTLADTLGIDEIADPTSAGVIAAVESTLAWFRAEGAAARAMFAETRTELARTLGTLPDDVALSKLAAAAIEHAFAQGVAHAMFQISDALGPEELEPVEHIGEFEETD